MPPKHETDQALAVYIHWPFCKSKCPYCDFNAHVRADIDEEAWRAAYLKSLAYYADLLPDYRVVSIFFGGGTPSLMAPDTAGAIIEAVQKHWRVANDIEITLEANPTSVEQAKFEAFSLAGVNRVSLGVQSLNEEDLKFLGREHDIREALRAIDIAAKNFSRYSFDLIYARPHHDLKIWQQELETALKIGAAHMSLYQLTIERSTPFYLRHAQGEFQLPHNDLAADLYLMTQDVMNAAGLPTYEVSNHAKPGHESRHNMMYWTYGDYIGIGPGAHGRFTHQGRKHASRDHHAPDIWLARVRDQGQGHHPLEALSGEDRFTEALMVGLRLPQGVSFERLEDLSGVRWQDMIDAQKLQALCDDGAAMMRDDGFRLSAEGLLKLNAVMAFLTVSS